MSKKQFKPDHIRWLRVIMWGATGFVFGAMGGSFVLAEITGLIYALVRFGGEWERVQHPERRGTPVRPYREWQTFLISWLAIVIVMPIMEYVTPTWLISMTVSLVGGLLALLSYLWQHRREPKQPEPSERPMSPKLAAHYEAAGLSDSEVSVFRETMANASKSVHQVESNVKGAVELQDIMAEFDAMNVMRAYFRAIVDQPKRMNEAAPFLYEQLPTLADLTHSYAVIQHHEVKTEDTYLVLSQAKTALEKLCRTIRDEYTAFVKQDLENLDATVELTRRQLDK